MPKNKGKGGKNRRRGKNENDFMKRELETKEAGQEYGQVNKMLGNGRVEATCFDGKTRICHIRGKLRKKVWIGPGDFILIGLRDYQDDKADVLQKYTSDEARRLKASGELPENAKINENDDQDEGEIVFKDMGGAEGEEEVSSSDDDMPSSGSEEEESEGEEDGKEESSSESEEDSEEEKAYWNEEDLARGRGNGGRGGRGGRGRGGKDKYGKRR